MTTIAAEDDFWNQKVTDRVNTVVAEGRRFWIAPEDRLGMRGFDGGRFVLEDLATGGRLVTTNLWCEGEIPERFRAQFPDTHRFVEEGRP